MLGGDGPRLGMAWSRMLSLPGTPVIVAGDEIGMGENLDIRDRMSVRVPMQWDGGPNGGFSTADPDALVRPMVTGDLGPQHVNVAAQRRDPDSLLNWIERLLRRRRELPMLGVGHEHADRDRGPRVFAHRCEWQDSILVPVHNLGVEPAEAELDLGLAGKDGVQIDDLVAGRKLRMRKDGTLAVKLDA